ncbi:MAG: two component transcriptional regulator, winged helix family, partial [Dehalococcoidia bacterium]|nr:two component transcriptional regulator, winged helix family [Dehalococcoidia bacterium]
MAKKITVLLVDDDPQLVRLVRANLESVGYRVLTAIEGRSALELVERETPDLLILDIMLPGMSGYE